jgi:CRP-like cAMP-binding protein
MTASSCIYVAVVIPFSLAFSNLYSKPGASSCIFHASSNDESVMAGLRTADVVIDFIFWMDMIINFMSAQWVLRTVPIPNWILIDDLDEIAKRYMSGMFLLDLMGSFPVQYFECIDQMDIGAIRLLRLVRLTKLTRLYRIKNMILTLEQNFPRSVFVITALQLLLYFFIGAHWCACIFFSITYGLGDPTSDDPWLRHLFYDGWAVGDGFIDQEGKHVKYTADPWLSSMYWAVTTMSTIGYGDISPGTVPERIMGMFLMSAGCAFFAWITGKITQLLTAKSACESRFEEALEELDTFMQARDLPEELRGMIHDYYKVKYPARRVFDEEEIIKDIESPSLKMEIILHLYKDVVTNVHLFVMCDEATKQDICFHLKSIYRMKGFQLTEAGEEPRSIFMVRFGLVELRGKGGKGRMASSGGLFGEMAILGLSPDGKRLRSSWARTVCELCEMSREDLIHIMSSRPSFYNIVRKACRIHHERMQEAYEETRGSVGVIGHSAETGHDFYDALSFMDWHSIYSQMLFDLRCVYSIYPLYVSGSPAGGKGGRIALSPGF